MRASREELSRREEALALSTTEAYRTASQGDDRGRGPHRSSGGQQAAVPSLAEAGDGVSLGVSGGGQGWTSGMQSVALGSPIREASPSSGGASGPRWGGAAVGGPGGGERRDSAGGAALRGGGGLLDVEARERQLEEWSNALAEQAEAMREQALKLETAYDRLREREAESLSSSKQTPPGGQHGDGGTEEAKTAAAAGGFPPLQPQKSGGAPSATAAAAAAAAAVASSSSSSPAVADGNTNGDGNAGHNVGAPVQQQHQPIESRQLEQETIRLSEKARELDAERRRLRLAAESADRERARAQAERQEASDSRRDAVALRVELERERTRLDAERGGLAAERSLLAAERGRLATERARSRRENDGNAAGGGGDGDGDENGDAAETAARKSERQGVAGASGSTPAGGGAAVGAREGIRFEGAGDGPAHRGEAAESEGFGARPAPASDTPPAGSAAAAGAEQSRPAHVSSRREISAGVIGGAHDTENGSSGAGAMASEDNAVGAPGPRAGNKPGRPAGLSHQVHEPGIAGTSRAGQDAPASVGSLEDAAGSVGRGDRVEGSAGDGEGSVEERGEARENGSSPRDSDRGQRRRDDDDGAEAGDEPPRPDHRSADTRATLRGDRNREGRGARRSDVPPPSIASVRRRLQGAGGLRRGEGNTADFSDDDSSSAVATPVRRRSGAAAAAAAVGRSESLGNSSNSAEALRPYPHSGSSSGRGHALSRGQSHRPVPEDPFLAQLHARLAGADHTLRQSLGRREALLSRFGADGSSVAPTSEGDTSDQNAHSPASVTVSLDAAAASSSSSPPDGAERREGGDGVARSDDGSGSGLESSPDTDTRGGRFGYTGRGARGGGGRRAPRRAELGGGNAGGVQRRQRSRLAPVVVVPTSETMTSVSGTTMSPARGNASAADAFSTPSAVRFDGRGARSGAGESQTGAVAGAGYRRQAGRDTDDTEAEKENLRELMLALGADDVHDGDGDGDGDGEAGRGHRAGVEERRGERNRDGSGIVVEDTADGAGVYEEEHRDEDEHRHEEERRRRGGGDAASPSSAAAAAPTGEADAGGRDTLMSSVRARNEDISSRLQDMSLQVCFVSVLGSFTTCA